MVLNYAVFFGKVSFCFLEAGEEFRIIVDKHQADEYVRLSLSEIIITNNHDLVPEGKPVLGMSIFNWLTNYTVKFPYITTAEVTSEYLKKYIRMQKDLIEKFPKFIKQAIECTRVFRVVKIRFVSDVGTGADRLKRKYEFDISNKGESELTWILELYKNWKPSFLNKWMEIKFREVEEEYVRKYKLFGEHYRIVRFRPSGFQYQPSEIRYQFPGRMIIPMDNDRELLAEQIMMFFYQEDVKCFCKLKGQHAFVLAPGPDFCCKYNISVSVEDI